MKAIIYFQFSKLLIMKKYLLLFISFLFTFSVKHAQAQRLLFFNGNIQYSAPLDESFTNYYSSGLGVNVGIGVGMNKTFITGTTGYSRFFAKSDVDIDGMNYIPIKLGVRHYIVGKMVFLNAAAGVAIENERDVETQTKFAGDVGGGVKIKSFEAILNFETFKETDPLGWATWIGIKAGWNFSL
jgi:hypothetical protein